MVMTYNMVQVKSVIALVVLVVAVATLAAMGLAMVVAMALATEMAMVGIVEELVDMDLYLLEVR